MSTYGYSYGQSYGYTYGRNDTTEVVVPGGRPSSVVVVQQRSKGKRFMLRARYIGDTLKARRT